MIQAMILMRFLRVCPVLLVILASCSTTRAPRELSPAEQVQNDNQIGERFSHQFEALLRFKKDIEIEIFLKNLSHKLAKTYDTVKESPFQIFLIEPPTKKSRIENFSIPGIRIYLSKEIVRNMQFENSLAAMIALEISKVIHRVVMSKIEVARETDENIIPTPYMEPSWFSIPPEKELAVLETAIEILYQANYDPRGLIGLMKNYQENPSLTRESPETLQRYIEDCYQIVSQYTPLKNPVIRSQEFVGIQGRLRVL